MNKPLISYLVTCKNEGYQLQSLLEMLFKYKDNAECVILDDYTDCKDTLNVIRNAVTQSDFFRTEKNHLNNDYGSHKNTGKSFCKGEWVFQIDADEIPSEMLLANLVDILESNPNTDLFFVPRINKFEGVTEEHAKRWGWDIDNPGKWVNWKTTGDYQTRIFKNVDYMKWENRLHERVAGFKTYTVFPKEEDYALIHTKTIEKQEETNLRYNRDFTTKENTGR
jgi:glycosyltransferase involved in cell wall biosynthesis